MFLKQISLKGFKSFADATVVDVEPGVTVVVGPNGSGKSNIVDAVAWALGAQAPSSVRSQKMDDVIFAGTADRSPHDRAEVSLLIDNSCRSLPVDLTEVTISRILLRSGESEYCLNGTPCRLLDIQELLSDAALGRQQHIIISQGQIDAVLNARPHERRMIVEDAAGILKFRKRREKAESRLRSSESDLDRLSDMQREVRRQLRPLEHQAEAARRHGGLVDELLVLRRYRSALEFREIRERAREETRRRIRLAKLENDSQMVLQSNDQQLYEAETELAGSGGDDLGNHLMRYESLRERGRGLRAVLIERQRGIDRDRKSFVSQQVVLGIETDKMAAEAELALLETEAEALAPEAEHLALAETDLAADRAAFDVKWADGVALLRTDAAEVRGELGVLRATQVDLMSEREGLLGRLTYLGKESEQLDAAANKLRGELSEGESTERPMAEHLAELEVRLRAAVIERNRAWERFTALEADTRTVRARSEALALTLDGACSRSEVTQLDSMSGVLGTLLDLVDIEEGYEAAFEAAASEVLGAVVVEDIESALDVLTTFRKQKISAAVLALGRELPEARLLVGTPISSHVRARSPEVEQLLNGLLGGVALVESEKAVETALDNPEAILVTKLGDRYSPFGWAIGGDRGGAIADALADADAQLIDLERERSKAEVSFSELEKSVETLEIEVTRRNQELDDHDQRFSVLVEGLQRLQTERRNVSDKLDGFQSRAGELDARLRSDQLRIAELESRLPDLESAESTAAESARMMTEERSAFEERVSELSGRRTAYEVRSADLAARRKLLLDRVTEYSMRLDELNDQRREVDHRRAELDGQEAATTQLIKMLDSRLSAVTVCLNDMHTKREHQSEKIREVAQRLDGLRRDRSKAERELQNVREDLSKLEVERAETRLRLENLTDSISAEFDCEAEDLVQIPSPDLPKGVNLVERISELQRELELLGPVNPLALEEYEALQVRHDFFGDQLGDIRSTRRELRKIIRSIDDEIAMAFEVAFGAVSKNFSDLFETLFPGGAGKLYLTDPENLLDTGVEIEAKPPGKNIKKLSLLSGGERSLAALAFLFAVFRSRPSPFYVMDEVEAALDDVNLHRFLGLVEEFRKDAQLLIVSHQKRTMEAADCLYGVTMAPGGSSRVISERLDVDRVSEAVALTG